MRFIDLFCGIGGFHVAAESLNMRCVFASEIDRYAAAAYAHNHGLHPHGDITSIDAKHIPDHDILCAGFPCQPFSIIGKRRGTSDPRGTLFHDILRILREKRPEGLLLENVRQLAGIEGGRTLEAMLQALSHIGYDTDTNILNALHYGLPQKRERLLFVGRLRERGGLKGFRWPDPVPEAHRKLLSDILEERPDPKHTASSAVRQARAMKYSAPSSPMIWHENKSGHIKAHPFSCALRAGASYNYLLVDGQRRLTPREMLRLQGFPDHFEMICSDSQTRKQAGNAVPVPMIAAVLERLQYIMHASTDANYDVQTG